MNTRPAIHTFLLFLFILVCALYSFGQRARVATWNIKGFDPIPAIRARLIAHAIHNLSPDLIALSEVNSSNVAYFGGS